VADLNGDWIPKVVKTFIKKKKKKKVPKSAEKLLSAINLSLLVLYKISICFVPDGDDKE